MADIIREISGIVQFVSAGRAIGNDAGVLIIVDKRT